MSISKNSLLLHTSGAIGKQVVVKQYGDKIVLAKYPDMSNRQLSPRQQEANKLMRAANLYAKGVIKDQGLKKATLLRLKVPENKLYRALIKEFMLNKGEPG